MASSMGAPKGLPVNASVLDSLVLEYMTSEGLIDSSDEPRELSEVNTHSTTPVRTSGHRAGHVQAFSYQLLVTEKGGL